MLARGRRKWLITKGKFRIAVESKIGWLTKHYMDGYGFTARQAYKYLYDSGVVDVLKDRDSRLFLESATFVVEAVDTFYLHGSQEMKKYLTNNIGG